MQKLVYGLDFGTSNSAIAILNKHGRSEVLKIGSGGEKTIKSVLFFPYVREGTHLHYVGDDAVNNYVSSSMFGRLLQSIKSILPEEFFLGTLIQGEWLEAEDLVALVLGYIKNKADKLVDQEVKDVVLGIPAKFSNNQDAENIAKQRLFSAAQKVGFERIEFQLEPIAAALHYESSITEEKLVFIADLGGGTSDFTVMKLSPEKASNSNRKEDILASGGICIGGDDFDSDIMWNKLSFHFGRDSTFQSYGKILSFPTHIVRRLSRWQDITFMKNKETNNSLKKFAKTSNKPELVNNLITLINKDLGFSLFREIERAKISLSSTQTSEIIFKHFNINISEKINGKEFEEFTYTNIEKIEKTAEDVLTESCLTARQIDSVFITGGTSIIPAVRNVFEKKFGTEKIVSIDSFTSVVSGLALSSKLFF